jgi:hypothetical protein
MQSNDFPGSWTMGPPTLTPAPSPSNRMSTRARKLAAAGLLTIGMLAGGVAAVSAATPSTSPAPQASAGTSGGTSGGTAAPTSGNCPNM